MRYHHFDKIQRNVFCMLASKVFLLPITRPQFKKKFRTNVVLYIITEGLKFNCSFRRDLLSIKVYLRRVVSVEKLVNISWLLFLPVLSCPVPASNHKLDYRDSIVCIICGVSTGQKQISNQHRVESTSLP